MLAGAAARAQAPASAQERVALYSAAGPVLTAYGVDIGAATLAERASVTLPQNVQEAWPHPSRRILYVGWSNNARGAAGRHGITAFNIDSETGALQPHGQPVSLSARPVFLTADAPGNHVVVAYNDPAGATVHRLARDGALGAEVVQPAGLDFGVYPHQVRVDPSNRMVIVVARGNAPSGGKLEDPGALKVFAYKNGVLANRASIAPGGGHNFQPRHLDFHPTRPFVFLTLERQNKLQVYSIVDGRTLGSAPLFTRETLLDPARGDGQATSAIHVHPNGRFVYLGNRGAGTTEFQGKRVHSGENSIAVYSIDQQTGEPALIQNADSRGVHPRTFTLDPSGRILVVANMQRALVRNGGEARTVPACLSVFRIGSDGKLQFVRKYDQDTGGGRNLFWTGMAPLP
jgi:6-phosphogluconolactonase (cycloisomerase 2 family)